MFWLRQPLMTSLFFREVLGIDPLGLTSMAFTNAAEDLPCRTNPIQNRNAGSNPRLTPPRETFKRNHG